MFYQGLTPHPPKTNVPGRILPGDQRREPFLCLWGYVDKESPLLNTYHSLFKFPNSSKDKDGLDKNRKVVEYSRYRVDE